MDPDQRFRELLEAAVPAETGRAEARATIMQRVRVLRRRRRVVRATGAVTAAAAVLSVVLIWTGTDATTRLPVIGREAGEVDVTTGCGDYAVPQAVAEYLDDWTTGGLTRGQTCVLEAVGGPEPAFDTGGLGDEAVWLDDDLSRGRVELPERMSADDLPVVYVGTSAIGGDPDLRWRLLRSWTRPPTGAGVWWCTSTSSGGGCGDGVDGEAALTSGTIGSRIDLLVPADTAVAALAIDGEPVAWQRPRGRTVLFSPHVSGQRYTVTAYNASGSVIGEYPGDLIAP
jgi:hypothetical protein